MPASGEGSDNSAHLPSLLDNAMSTKQSHVLAHISFDIFHIQMSLWNPIMANHFYFLKFA